MQSFIEYVGIKEGVKDLVRGFRGWASRNEDQGKLESQAIASLKAIITNLEQSTDSKLKSLYNSGYAGELYKIIRFIEKRNNTPEEERAFPATEGVIGGALGAAAGGLAGGVPGAMVGGVAGHYAQKAGTAAWNATTASGQAMAQHTNLENQAMKDLQNVVNFHNYEKGDKYHDGFAARLQGWITRIKQMQQFNKQPQPSEISPDQGFRYRRVPVRQTKQPQSDTTTRWS